METNLESLLFSHLGLDKNAFAGSVIVVTGAGRGIGEQAGRAFALLGGRVVLAELNKTGKQVEASIRAEGGDALFVQTDISDPASVARLALVTHEEFGPVDILVNNAVLCPVSSVMDMELSLWDRVIAVNLRGLFLTCKVFLPDMLARKRGTIINMVSPNPMPGLSAYIASKHGMIGFSQCLAQEVGGQGVRVIPFGPGMVDTPAIREAAANLAPMLGMTAEQFTNLSLHPAYGGLMPPEHAGAATAYLAAKLADEFHGQVTDGYEVLEKAGFLQKVDNSVTTSSTPASAPEPVPLIELLRQLQDILTETEQEFDKLPAFIRPMARGGFKSKSGLSLVDWQKVAANLLEEAENGKLSHRPEMCEAFKKLIVYYRDVPKETARFSKDPEFLKQAAKLSSKRAYVIESLLQAGL